MPHWGSWQIIHSSGPELESQQQESNGGGGMCGSEGQKQQQCPNQLPLSLTLEYSLPSGLPWFLSVVGTAAPAYHQLLSHQNFAFQNISYLLK